MKSGEMVRFNLENILKNYRESLVNNIEIPDYRFIIYVENNIEREYEVERVVYNKLVKIKGIDKLIDIGSLEKVRE